MKKNKKGTVARIFELARKSKGIYMIGVVFSAIGMVMSAVPFYTVYRLVERLLSTAGTDGGSTMFWALVTAVSICVGIISTLLGGYFCHRAAFQVQYDLRMHILNHMGKLNLGFYSGNRSGATQKMMDENVEQIEKFLSHIFPNLVGSGVLLVLLAVFMFYLNVWLAVTVFGAIMIAFVIQFTAFGGENGKKIWTELNHSSTDLDAEFSEYINGMEEEKIFGSPETAARKITDKVWKQQSWYIRYLKRVTPVFGAYKTITLSLLAFILTTGTILLCQNPADTGLMITVLTFVIVGPAVYNPLMELVELSADMRNIAVRLNQIDEVLVLPPLKEPQKETVPAEYSICLQKVSFSYQEAGDEHRKLALDCVDIQIPCGKLTALVGPSGGGKSTVGQLINRFWDVEQGKITIGGVDIRDMKHASLMDITAFVFQDTYIFADTVWNNISMNREAAKEEIIAAAKSARCHDFIESLPNGYDTRLGDGGHKLSGGEGQRIAIARAILKNAPIVILDEAMAFADAENEVLIRQAMSALLKGKTVLMIAHRLYSIKNADNIVVMDDGRVSEQGTHSQLMESGGLYAKLWNIQNETGNWQMKGGLVHA